MRIGELARMVGTSTRSIRHYHRTGVLPEPPRSSNGYRHYGLEDLARVLRIKWLLAGGLSLREITGVLGSPSGRDRDLEAELGAALTRVRHQRARLEREEQVLTQLVEQVRAGQGPDAVSGEVLSGLAAVEEATGSDAGSLLAVERHALDLIAHRGVAGPEAQALVANAYRRVAETPHLVAALQELTTRLGALAGIEAGQATEQVDAAAELLDTVLSALDVEAFLAALHLPDPPGIPGDEQLWLTTLFPAPAQQAVIRKVLDRWKRRF